MCRSWWLWKWWIKSTVSRPKVCSLPLWSRGEALGVASRQAAALRCLGFQKWLLFSSNAQFPFLFLLQQTQALHHRWSCGGLVAPPQADIVAFTSPFWLVQGFGLGWRKACVRCYTNLSLSEWPFLSALALDLPFTGRVVVGWWWEDCLGSKPWFESSVQPALGVVMQDSPEAGRVGWCIFPSPAVEILPGARKGNVRYPA